MATIQYTTYKFHKPSLITNQDYDDIKKCIQSDPNYNPFPKTPGFFNNFKRELKIGGIGIIISALILALGEAIWWGFSIIGGIGLWIFVGSAIFSGIPTSLSYMKYMSSYSIYYRTLRKTIKNSNDYNDFKQKMENTWF